MTNIPVLKKLSVYTITVYFPAFQSLTIFDENIFSSTASCLENGRTETKCISSGLFYNVAH